MITTVETVKESDSMMFLGWVTITQLADGDRVTYGVFYTLEEAVSHGDKLVNASVVPIYAPTLH